MNAPKKKKESKAKQDTRKMIDQYIQMFSIRKGWKPEVIYLTPKQFKTMELTSGAKCKGIEVKLYA